MSQVITLNVRDKIASCITEKPVVCGNSDYEIHFDFDKEWNGHEVKTAVFTVNGKSVLKPFSGTVCKIPELNNTLILWVGVFAGTIDDGTLSTSTPALIKCVPCATDGDHLPFPPPDDVYNQIVELCDEAVSTANDVKKRADNGELDGKSAYQYAVEGGYEGSEEAFTGDIANINRAKESAEQSASDASASARIAVESAESAEQSASNASTSEQNASEAAQNASVSEQNAGQSAESAERAALDASASAQNANLSEQNAVQSAESAGLSAFNALESEQKASGHAQDAGTHREVTGRLSAQADKSAQDASASAESALASADRANAILEDVKKEADAPKRYANNVFANALKGHKSGTIVSADDVSPIEHELDVKVTDADGVPMADVTVKQYGKNLLPNSKADYTGYGMDYKRVPNGGVYCKGTPTVSSVGFQLPFDSNLLRDGVTYRLSGSKTTEGVFLYLVYKNGEETNYPFTKFTWSKDYTFIDCHIQVNKGTTIDTTIYPMLEVGNTATEYEPYREPFEAVSEEDGSVKGLPCKPTMTLISDEGVVIDCTYNRDINKAFEQITQAMVSMGANI